VETTRVGVYERTVHASLERVWENVFDWEHLPWLHRRAFRSIRREDEGPWGWRARVGLAGARGGEILLELRVEKEALRYVARTLEGSGKGTEVWTRLSPHDAERTAIEVSFHLPGVAPGKAAALGDAYRILYARLWDEDEAMMRHRSAALARLGAGAVAPAHPVDLGLLSELRERLPLSVETGGRRWRVVGLGDELVAHGVSCPHMLGPLDTAELEDGCLRCPWHGYRFDVRTGRSADGRPLRLPRAPRVEVDPAGRAWLVTP
jgi:nitrite reductase/ring-hydroxylating ferredoxin subunit